MDVRRLASRLWRALVRRPLGRFLHSSRRWAAIRRVRARRDTIRSILFVCHGNICRSPYAAEAFRRLLSSRSPDVTVRSAGFIAPGRPAPPNAVAVAGRHEVDLGPHRSQLVDAARVGAADLVVVMDPRQGQEIRLRFGRRSAAVLILADLLPVFEDARVVPDPIDGPPERFERVYSQIDECLRTLASALGVTVSEGERVQPRAQSQPHRRP